jgi:DNA polymerase
MRGGRDRSPDRTGSCRGSCVPHRVRSRISMSRAGRRPKGSLAPERMGLDKTAVPPEGSSRAWLYLVGEAPGRQEAEIGRPFVGRAGEALREMMREAGIDTSRVRLANAIPYRPVERSSRGRLRNRRPTDKELRAHGRVVLNDIAKVRPKLIGALGRSAATLFGALMPVEQARRRAFQFQGMPVRITYHPGFVLRFGGKGSALWRSGVRDLNRFWREAGEGRGRTPVRPRAIRRRAFRWQRAHMA